VGLFKGVEEADKVDLGGGLERRGLRLSDRKVEPRSGCEKGAGSLVLRGGSRL